MPDSGDIRRRLLDALARADRSLSNTELADACEVALESVSRALRSLDAEGLIVRREDGRSVLSLLKAQADGSGRPGRQAATTPDVAARRDVVTAQSDLISHVSRLTSGRPTRTRRNAK
jgi:DNA-binding transcriptional ArsR family regulator